MTPKEKAQELFDKYYIICQEFTQEIQCSIQAKQCALIAVDEILKITWIDKFLTVEDYWKQVKHEIEIL
jgi:predicted nucleotide-binding protein (sugar kinase/HSP70/actin superfamily)